MHCIYVPGSLEFGSKLYKCQSHNSVPYTFECLPTLCRSGSTEHVHDAEPATHFEKAEQVVGPTCAYAAEPRSRSNNTVREL